MHLIRIRSKHFFVEKWLLVYCTLTYSVFICSRSFKLAPLKNHFSWFFAMYSTQFKQAHRLRSASSSISSGASYCCCLTSPHCLWYQVSHAPQWGAGLCVSSKVWNSFQVGPILVISNDGPALLPKATGIWHSLTIPSTKSFLKNCEITLRRVHKTECIMTKPCNPHPESSVTL